MCEYMAPNCQVHCSGIPVTSVFSVCGRQTEAFCIQVMTHVDGNMHLGRIFFGITVPMDASVLVSKNSDLLWLQ